MGALSKIISIILLFLAAVTFIGTWLFIKKDNQSKLTKERKKLEKSENKSNPEEKIYTHQEIKEKWNIVDIVNDIVTLKGSRYCALLTLGTIDFNMLSEAEQQSVEKILRQTAIAFQYCTQFHSTTESVDTSETIELIKSNFTHLKSFKRQTYSKKYMEYLNNMTRDRGIYIRKNCIVISFDGPAAKAVEELDRRCTFVTNSLKRANIVCTRVPSNQILDVYYNILNKNSNNKPSKSVEAGGLDLYVSGTSRKSEVVE